MELKYHRLPALNAEYINNQDYFLLFETSLFDKHNFTSYIFMNPVDVIKIRQYRDVRKAFERIEEYSKEHYLAGYFSYELGYYFEKDFFKPISGSPYPLIHLCVFDKMAFFDHRTGKASTAIPGLFDETNKRDFLIKNLKFNFTKAQYFKKIRQIKEYIKNGETYQVNFTGKYCFDFSGSAFSLYDDLKNRQNVPYGAFCKFKDEYVISLSPELYFKREGLRIYSRPMKGTIERGRNIEEDRERVSQLKDSIKDLAENLMIVDLVRNDLGRISETDSVKVARLFTIEKYNTLFQITSTIKSTLKKYVTYFDIFKSIFPGGSVTGAPKIRTMQIIRKLEKDYRNVYCGALGVIYPGNKAMFNLPIRTISLIKNKGEMGVGGGIVIDSSPQKEFEECLLKAKFITDRYKTFQLIETLLWDGEYRFLNEHLERMKESADYFDFYFKHSRIIAQLKSMERQFMDKHNYRVRLLLDRDGNLRIDYSKIEGTDYYGVKYAAISKHKTDPGAIFLYHKTTNRSLYDSEYNYYRLKGYYEVIFLNKRNEFTEGSISNIIVRIDKKYFTPPVASGLLPGIFREYLIKKHRVREKILKREDLKRADKVYVCNSVRGLTELKLDNKREGGITNVYSHSLV